MPSYSKEELIMKQKIYDRDNEIKKLSKQILEKEAEIFELKSKISALEINVASSYSEKDIIKKVLALYAKNFSYKEIFDKLKFIGFKDIDIDFIVEVCNNIDELDSDLILFFKEQEKAYIEQITMDVTQLKDRIYTRYEKLYNDACYDLTKVETIDERQKLRTEIRNITTELNKFFKNIVEEKSDEVFEEAVASMSKLEELNKILEFEIEEEEEEAIVIN